MFLTSCCFLDSSFSPWFTTQTFALAAFKEMFKEEFKLTTMVNHLVSQHSPIAARLPYHYIGRSAVLHITSTILPTSHSISGLDFNNHQVLHDNTSNMFLLPNPPPTGNMFYATYCVCLLLVLIGTVYTLHFQYKKFFSRWGLAKDLPWINAEDGRFISRARINKRSLFGTRELVEAGYRKVS